MDHTLILLSALLLNALFAGPRQVYALTGIPALSRRAGAWIHGLEARLDREHRSLRDRQLRGAIVLISGLLPALLAGLLLHKAGFWAELLACVILLPVRPLFDRTLAMRRALEAEDMQQARRLLEGTPWRHHARLDQHGVSRAAIESLFVDWEEKIIAPACFYLVFGLPGLLADKMLALLRGQLTLPQQEGAGFGQSICLTQRLAHYIPARLCWLLWLAVAGIWPASEPLARFKRIMKCANTEPPPALMVACAAQVLDISLGGASSPYLHNWTGTGTPRPTAYDVRRALLVYALLCALFFVLAGLPLLAMH